MPTVTHAPAKKAGRPAPTGCTAAIRAYLRDFIEATPAEIAEATGYPSRTIANLLGQMAKKGECTADRRPGCRVLGYALAGGDLLLTDAEIAERVRLVEAAKLAKFLRGEGTDLEPWELDAVLPPQNNWKTRQRLASPTGRVLAYLREHGESSTTQITASLGITNREFWAAASGLRRRGALVSTQRGEVTTWRLAPVHAEDSP